MREHAGAGKDIHVFAVSPGEVLVVEDRTRGSQDSLTRSLGLEGLPTASPWNPNRQAVPAH